MPRTQGIELFVRDGLNELDSFPQLAAEQASRLRPIDLRLIYKEETEEQVEYEVTASGRSRITRLNSKRVWSLISTSAARRETHRAESRPTQWIV
jgi:hypothetical protein